MEYPEQYEQQPQYEPRKSPTEVIIGNIIKAVVCIFIIVLGFFLVIMVVAVTQNQTAIEFTTYNETFATTIVDMRGSFPYGGPVVYTSNPLLSSFTIDQYRPGFGHIWTTSSSADYVYTSSNTTLLIKSPTWFTGDSYAVSANTDYSEVPALSVMSAWALALVILAIAGIFGLVGWRHYNRNQYNQYR